MAMGCPHQGRSGGLNATITSRPFDSPRPSPGGYRGADPDAVIRGATRLGSRAATTPFGATPGRGAASARP